MMNNNVRQMVLSALHNASGYPMGDVESELGYGVAIMTNIFNTILSNSNYEPTENEWGVIKDAFRLCLKYIDEWEFPAVFDYSKVEVVEFYNKL